MSISAEHVPAHNVGLATAAAATYTALAEVTNDTFGRHVLPLGRNDIERAGAVTDTRPVESGRAGLASARPTATGGFAPVRAAAARHRGPADAAAGRDARFRPCVLEWRHAGSAARPCRRGA
jgi:hypothetical protein